MRIRRDYESAWQMNVQISAVAPLDGQAEHVGRNHRNGHRLSLQAVLPLLLIYAVLCAQFCQMCQNLPTRDVDIRRDATRVAVNHPRSARLP